MNILKNILLEMGFAGSVSVTEISNAVTHMLSADIVYDDGKGGNGKAVRHICPVAYGLSTAGNPVVRAFQTAGSTKSAVPHWKLFDVTKISSWETNNDEKYDPSKLVGFNKDGDKQMEIIYSISPIGNAKDIEVAKSQNMPDGIQSAPITKSDINKEEPIDNNGGEEKVDNSRYTANNAINDVLRSANLSNLVKKVDNGDENNYTNTKDNETAPVKVSDIPGGDKNVDNTKSEEGNEENSMPISDEPVRKDDLEADSNESEITTSFKDMMKRMDNLNKDEDENNLEDENGN